MINLGCWTLGRSGWRTFREQTRGERLRERLRQGEELLELFTFPSSRREDAGEGRQTKIAPTGNLNLGRRILIGKAPRPTGRLHFFVAMSAIVTQILVSPFFLLFFLFLNL